MSTNNNRDVDRSFGSPAWFMEMIIGVVGFFLLMGAFGVYVMFASFRQAAEDIRVERDPSRMSHEQRVEWARRVLAEEPPTMPKEVKETPQDANAILRAVEARREIERRRELARQILDGTHEVPEEVPKD